MCTCTGHMLTGCQCTKLVTKFCLLVWMSSVPSLITEIRRPSFQGFSLLHIISNDLIHTQTHTQTHTQIICYHMSDSFRTCCITKVEWGAWNEVGVAYNCTPSSLHTHTHTHTHTHARAHTNTHTTPPPSPTPCMCVRGCNVSVCWADSLFCPCDTHPCDRYWAVISVNQTKSLACIFIRMLILLTEKL